MSNPFVFMRKQVVFIGIAARIQWSNSYIIGIGIAILWVQLLSQCSAMDVLITHSFSNLTLNPCLSITAQVLQHRYYSTGMRVLYSAQSIGAKQRPARGLHS